MESIDGALVISASGFASKNSAVDFFRSLKRRFTAIAVEERIPAAFPAFVDEAKTSPFSFIPGDVRCVSRGWPDKMIQPLAVSKYRASIYPEHEYVAIDEVISFTPAFTYSAARLAEQLASTLTSSTASTEVGETMLIAAIAYAHAARTSQWVWSFLLTVMALEMLADQGRTNHATRSAIAELLHYAEAKYGSSADVDIKRIRDCLRQAGTISKTKAIKELIKKHCAPGIAAAPLTNIYVDEADCDKKVTAIYAVRSKYVHEGRMPRTAKVTFPFDVLHNAALASLQHIIRILLAS